MTKLTNSVGILSKTGAVARLTAIDTETKTCIIYNGKERVVKWSSAAEYKLDTSAEKKPTLTPKLLKALHDAEAVDHSEETAAETDTLQTPTSEPSDEPQENAPETVATTEVPVPASSDVQEAAEPPKVKRQRTPRGTLTDREKTFLSMIPAQPDFKGVSSELGARALIKKALELHNLPIETGRAVFVSLKNKGYYTTKGRESGLTLTTFQLTELGVKYLTENNLLPVDEAQTEKIAV